MCYFLYIASPLTLSEVRSMLPPGVTADLATQADLKTLQAMHPQAKTVALLMAGRCSCDLVRTRLADPREDERHLRTRYRSLGICRPATIAALERHRRGAASRTPMEGWPVALAKFVAEHARNAGPTLYLLSFEPNAGVPRHGSDSTPATCSLREIGLNPDGWLIEGTPVMV